MSDEKTESKTTDLPESSEPKKSGVDWTDPTVPIGNAPPMPKWPAALSAIAWVGWIAFLVAMLVSSSEGAAT